MSPRLDWGGGISRAAEVYPSIRERDWTEALSDIELLGSIVRDVLALAGAPRRKGQRPAPTRATHGALLARIIDGADEHTLLAYADAVRAAWPTDDEATIAARIDVDPALVHAALAGATPTTELLDATARAMGRRPVFFREHRTHLIVTFLGDHLDRYPEAGVRLATHLDRRRQG